MRHETKFAKDNSTKFDSRFDKELYYIQEIPISAACNGTSGSLADLDGRTGRNLELLLVLMYDDTMIIYNLIILLPRSLTASPLMRGTQLLSFLGQR